MTTSTHVVGRRLRARLALLSFSTALCSGLVFSSAPATAQQAGLTSGDALNVPSYDPVDANGVDLLSGRFSVRSPMLSMGGADAPSKFYFTWTGQLWMPNTPRLWLDKNWHVIVEHDGISEEFADAKPTGNSPGNGAGPQYSYTQKRPNVGSSLTCTFAGAVSGGNSWITSCFYNYRSEKSIRFWGNTAYNGSYPSAAANDYDQFGNARVWPGIVIDPKRGNTAYLTDGLYTRGYTDGGSLAVDYPNGVKVSKQQSYWSPTIAITMVNKAVAGSNQVLTISTPNLDGSDRSKSYLRPKGTTQTFTDPLGRVSSYTFNSAGDLVQVMTPAGVIATIIYDGSHRVTSYTKNGNTWNYSYDFAASSTGGGTSTVVAPDNTRRTLTHNASPGPVTASTDELGHTTSYQHDGYDRLTEIDRPNDDGTSYAASTYLYDARGNLTQTTTYPKPNLGGDPVISKAVYPDTCGAGIWCNEPSQLIDARGGITDIAYDQATGLPATITRPAGSNGVRPQTRNIYTAMGYWSKDANGNPVQATDRTMPKLTETATCMTQGSCVGTPDETKTVYSFGFRDGTAANNLEPVAVTKQLGSGTVLSQVGVTYDGVGNTTYIDGPIAGTADTSRMIWDADREKIGEIGPAPGNGLPPVAVRNTYNDDGQATLVEQGNAPDQSDNGWNQFSMTARSANVFDGAGRLATSASAGTGGTVTVTQMSYDPVGRTRCVAIRMNDAAFPSIAVKGALSGGQLPADACSADTSGAYGPDRVTQTDYDAVGHPIAITQAVGTDVPQVQARYTWNVAGKRTSVTDGNGNVATMDYDGFDRQSRWTFPSPTSNGQPNSSDYEAYRYDAAGNRVWYRKRDGREFTFDYDALNHVVDKIVPDGCVSGYACTPVSGSATRDVYYGYDLRGLLTYARFDNANGEGLSMTYNGLGQPIGSSTALGGSTRAMQFTFDGASNRTGITYPDNQVFQTVYDAMSRPTSVTQTDGSTIDIPAYEVRGYQTGRFNGLAGYGYDAIGRLSSLGVDLSGAQADVSLGFGYNPASQIASETRSNDSYAYHGFTNANQAYAVNGLDQYTAIGSAGLSYDANGNLTGSGSLNYTYDAENRVVQASNGTQLTYDPLGHLFQIASGSGVTQFLYDGDRIAAEYDASGNMLRRYVHGPSGDDPMFWYEGPGLANRRLLFADRQGSIVAVSDAGGNLVGTNSYDEYGQPGNGNVGRFQYTGQTWFPELNAYYYKARFYSPALGRFLQTDPIGYADQVNLYGYVANDPLNGRDPTGTQDDRLPDLTATYQATGAASNQSSTSPISFSFAGLFSGPQLPPLVATMQAVPPTLQKSPSVICRIAKAVPGNRIRLGADAAGGLGGLIALGTGISLEDSGRIVWDAYGGAGPGVGAIAGAGLSLDGSSTPNGWSGSTALTVQGAWGLIGAAWTHAFEGHDQYGNPGTDTGGLSVSLGPKAGATIGRPLVAQHGSTLYDFGC